MVAANLALLFALCVLPSAWALEVTPNSACARVCMDDAAQDASDPGLTNTYGSDIVCRDDEYSSTDTGQRFEDCLNCLQNSTVVESDESDQAWFLCEF